MRYMSEKEYNYRMKQIHAQNITRQRMQELKDEENKYKRKLKLPSTSKLMAIYLWLLMSCVLVYAMVAMWVFRDLTYLGVLITDIAGQVLVYFIYAKKSTIENTSGGVVFEKAMLETKNMLNNKINNEDNNSVG